MRFGRGCNSIYRVAQRTKREAATSINLCANQSVSWVQTATPSSWRRVATFDLCTAVNSDDDTFLVHEDSYLWIG